MKKFRKAISIILAMVFIFTCLTPVTSIAEEDIPPAENPVNVENQGEISSENGKYEYYRTAAR